MRSFDLTVSRVLGRRAPVHPGGLGVSLAVAQEAYRHEVSSAGFWPGSGAFPHTAFDSYAYPAPPGFADAQVPAPGRFDPMLGEFVVPYAGVRAARNSVATLMMFLQATCAAAADLGRCGPGTHLTAPSASPGYRAR